MCRAKENCRCTRLSKQLGGGLYEWIAPLLPKKGLTLPGLNYCGPGNPLPNGPPANRVDAVCMRHDYAYNDAIKYKKENPNDPSGYSERIRAADLRMLDELAQLDHSVPPMTVGERLSKAVAGTAIGAKTVLDKITGNGVNSRYRGKLSFY